MSLQYGILGILSYAPMNGYTLKKLFNTSINYIWTASLSQIYRELSALEGKGFVTSRMLVQDDRPDKRVYTITEEGRVAFLAWLKDFPDTLTAPKRDEFMLRVFFGSSLGKEELIAQFQRFIEERKQVETDMSANQEMYDDRTSLINKKLALSPGPKDALLWRMINRRAVRTNTLLLEWAEECISELEKTDAFD